MLFFFFFSFFLVSPACQVDFHYDAQQHVLHYTLDDGFFFAVEVSGNCMSYVINVHFERVNLLGPCSRALSLQEYNRTFLKMFCRNMPNCSINIENVEIGTGMAVLRCDEVRTCRAFNSFPVPIPTCLSTSGLCCVNGEQTACSMGEISQSTVCAINECGPAPSHGTSVFYDDFGMYLNYFNATGPVYALGVNVANEPDSVSSAQLVVYATNFSLLAASDPFDVHQGNFSFQIKEIPFVPGERYLLGVIYETGTSIEFGSFDREAQTLIKSGGVVVNAPPDPFVHDYDVLHAETLAMWPVCDDGWHCEATTISGTPVAFEEDLFVTLNPFELHRRIGPGNWNSVTVSSLSGWMVRDVHVALHSGIVHFYNESGVYPISGATSAVAPVSTLNGTVAAYVDSLTLHPMVVFADGTMEEIANTIVVNSHIDIANVYDRLRVCFEGNPGYGLLEAHRHTTGDWVSSTVDYIGGLNCSIADVGGRPLIAYLDGSGTLKRVWWNDSDWDSDNVTSLASGYVKATDKDVIAHSALKFWGRNIPSLSFTGLASAGNESLFAITQGEFCWRTLSNVQMENPPAPDCSYWSIEYITQTGAQGEDVSLTILENGTVAVAHIDKYTGDLFYSWRIESNNWGTMPVTTGTMFSHWTSIAEIGTNVAICTYRNESYDDLYYHTFDGVSWVSTMISGITNRRGKYCSLREIELDVPGISFQDSTTYDLMYIERNGTTWFVETVDTRGAGSYTSLAVYEGRPAICYHSGGARFAWRFANRTGWILEAIKRGYAYGYYCSLEIVGGLPMVAFYDSTRGDLWTSVRYPDGEWISTILRTSGNVGKYPSISEDANGYPLISYHDESHEDLRAVWHNGTRWKFEIVDAKYHVGEPSSSSPMGIAYYDYGAKNLRFAHKEDLCSMALY